MSAAFSSKELLKNMISKRGPYLFTTEI